MQLLELLIWVAFLATWLMLNRVARRHGHEWLAFWSSLLLLGYCVVSFVNSR